ncbi:MAG: hypothetical protein RLN72_16115 [Henriciella sp.]
MGLILIGDQKLADGILQSAFMRARAANTNAEERLSHSDLIQLGFDAFDDAVHRKGVVVVLAPILARDGSLKDQVGQLTYNERVSISLLMIEDMLLKDAAILSGLPNRILQDGLESALSKLDTAREPDPE